MLFLKYGMVLAGVGLLIVGAGIMLYDAYFVVDFRRRVARGTAENLLPPGPVRWRRAGKLAVIAVLPLLLSQSIVVVPSGMAGVRVSQISGTRPGTLYPGVHLVKPLVEQVALFDTRDQLFSTAAIEPPKKEGAAAPEVLKVQAREGLNLGLAVTVRYRLDARRLDFIQNTLPQPVDKEIVPAVVASAFRETVPNYTVRDVFATRREEVRRRAADQIAQKLGASGIVVEEVMLRDIQLPPEYAKGLEGLLLKEQENDRMGVETEIQQKQVRITELQAEAEKAAQVKHAEGEAQVHVLQAKAEADAMQYTLPLKQKQIEQSRLEAEARKEATIKNAEADAAAKVIDSKAELERRRLLADAEANRIRVTAAADAERLQSEAAILNKSPLLINKIIAERLSDKVQIMMVPTDGKFFFTNDVLQGMRAGQTSGPSDDPSGHGDGRR